MYVKILSVLHLLLFTIIMSSSDQGHHITSDLAEVVAGLHVQVPVVVDRILTI